MQQLTSSSLFQSLTSLTELSGQLSVRLAQAAKRLHETGEVPSETLLEEVATFRQRFLDLSTRGLAVAETLAIPALPPAEELISLHDLKALVQGIAKVEEQRTLYDDIRQRALTVLDRIMQLRHREHATFPPLLECQERAREMREAVAEARWPNLHPATESLASGEDPFSDLLNWIEQLFSLDDDEWALLQDAVEQFFGKPLAIAVSRGKLVLPATGHSPSALLPAPADSDTTTREFSIDPETFVIEEAEVEDLIVTIEPNAESVLDEVLLTDDPVAEPIFPQTHTVTPDEPSPPESAPQPLPETVPLGSLYSFGPEDSAQHIAAAIAGAQSDIPKPEALRDLMWRLLFEDKISLAFHLTSYIDAQQSQLQPRLPAWLLRTVLLGRHVRHAKGETARFLESDFAHFSPALYLPEQGEWNQAVTFLLIAATLQPALLAPQTQASAVLHALRWEAHLPHLTAYCKSIADYGAHQHPLDPNLLKKGKEQAAWQAEMDVLKQGVELWWARAARLPFSYAPATKVWQRWLEPKGVIATLLSPIRHSDPSKLAAVKRAIDMFADDAQLKREVEHTDRDILGRRLGNDINGRAFEQIRLYTREAMGFARRWVELQEIHLGQRQGSVQEQAERLRQTIWNLQGPLQEELSLFKRRHPSPLIMSSLACCRRALENLQLFFDPEATFPAEEPLPRPLIYADLLRIPTVSLNEQWEVEGSDWEALVDGVLDLVSSNVQKKTAA
jgi:hypothetical protein